MSKIIYIYRGTDRSETTLSCRKVEEKYSPLSQYYSRAIDSSRNKDASCVCFSEDPRVALRYALKNPNPIIVRLGVRINDDGSCQIIGHERDSAVQRLWTLEDWVYVASKSPNYTYAENLNYSTSPIPVENIIIYNRGSARAYARADKLWVVNCDEEKEIIYDDVLSEQEMMAVKDIHFFRLPSYRLLKYNREANIIPVCDYLIDRVGRLDTTKAYIKYSLEAYQKLRDSISAC